MKTRILLIIFLTLLNISGCKSVVKEKSYEPDDSASATESTITAEFFKPVQFAIPTESAIETEISKSDEVPSTGKGGILYYRLVNGSWGFFEKGDDEKDSKYIGDIKNKQPNGKGTINLPYGKYVGEWMNGLLDGFGIFDYFDGSKYIGNYKSGKTNGQGFWSMATGTIFTGEFKDDFMQGNGIISYKSGIQFIGKFRQGMPLQGTLLMLDGSSYVGELKDGNKMWNGQMFIEDQPYIPKYTAGKESIVRKQEESLFRWTTNYGDKWKPFGNRNTDWFYFGQVSNGVPNGQGILTLPDGTSYRGGIKDGDLHGVGVMAGKEDGISFKTVGEFKFGKANGQHFGKYMNGSFLVGEMREDQPWEAMFLDDDYKILNRWTNGIKKIKLDDFY